MISVDVISDEIVIDERVLVFLFDFVVDCVDNNGCFVDDDTDHYVDFDADFVVDCVDDDGCFVDDDDTDHYDTDHYDDGDFDECDDDWFEFDYDFDEFDDVDFVGLFGLLVFCQN